MRLVYARSPSRGEIEIVVSKEGKVEVYPLEGREIAALFGALSEAVRFNYVAGLSQKPQADSEWLGGYEGTFGDTPRPLRDPDSERMTEIPGLGFFLDKSHRKYEKRSD